MTRLTCGRADSLAYASRNCRTLSDHQAEFKSPRQANLCIERVEPGATVKESLTVRSEGKHEVKCKLRFYSLDLILAIGYRVRSPRGTQFRRWAMTYVKGYIVKGFVMDGERIVLVLDGLVEHDSDVVLEVLQSRTVPILLRLVPASSDGDEEGFSIGCLVLLQFGDKIRFIFKVRECLIAELLAFVVELVGKPLQDQHAKDELRSVHLAAQDVGGLKKEDLK